MFRKLSHCLKCRRGFLGQYHSCANADRRDIREALKQKINQEAFMLHVEKEMNGIVKVGKRYSPTKCQNCHVEIERISPTHKFCELCKKESILDSNKLYHRRKKYAKV